MKDWKDSKGFYYIVTASAARIRNLSIYLPATTILGGFSQLGVERPVDWPRKWPRNSRWIIERVRRTGEIPDAREKRSLNTRGSIPDHCPFCPSIDCRSRLVTKKRHGANVGPWFCGRLKVTWFLSLFSLALPFVGDANNNLNLKQHCEQRLCVYISPYWEIVTRNCTRVYVYIYAYNAKK